LEEVKRNIAAAWSKHLIGFRRDRREAVFPFALRLGR
jgi:hypothetical protein